MSTSFSFTNERNENNDARKRGQMNENEARYIVRMLDTFKSNVLFADATDKDSEEHDRIKCRYDEAGGWASGAETALLEFILRVDESGVPGGKYMIEKHDSETVLALDNYLEALGIPRIERPSSG